AIWAWVSDNIVREQVFLIMFLIQAVIFALLASLTMFSLVVMATASICQCYGGGIGAIAAFAAEYIGMKFVGGIYGIILLAWGLAAIPSPLLIAKIKDSTGTYTGAIYIIAAVALVSAILPFIVRPLKQEGSSDPGEPDDTEKIPEPE